MKRLSKWVEDTYCQLVQTFGIQPFTLAQAREVRLIDEHYETIRQDLFTLFEDRIALPFGLMHGAHRDRSKPWRVLKLS